MSVTQIRFWKTLLSEGKAWCAGRPLSSHSLWPQGWAIPSSGVIKEMDTMNISWGSLQGKKPQYHSLPVLLKLLALSWAEQRVVSGEGEFCLILRFFLSGLAASTFIHQLINKITDLRFHCRWVVLTLFSAHSALFGLNSFLSFEELRNKNNPEQLPLFSGQFHSFEMEIFNIALVNCENQLYCLSVPTRWPTDLLRTSSWGFFNSNFYFFLHSFLWVWNIYRTPYLFQLYIFIMTFLSKEFIKAQYLYTHTHTHKTSEDQRILSKNENTSHRMEESICKSYIR